jgi:hypothetical protein
VCIIPGCTVPVILRQNEKKDEDLEAEQMQDAIQSMKAALTVCEEACFRKIRYRDRLSRERKKDPEMETAWKREVREELEEVNRELKELKNQEDKTRAEERNRVEQQKRRKNEAENRRANKAGKERTRRDTQRPPVTPQRSTTMPSMIGRLHPTLGPGEAESEPGSLADAPGQVVGGQGDGPSQPPGRSRPEGNNQGQDGSQAPGGKSKEQAEKEEGERRRQERKKKAKEEDPKRWYKFIGEAYIHGMMDGEAVRLQINEGIPMRMFEIR